LVADRLRWALGRPFKTISPPPEEGDGLIVVEY
jgi:hypothetical protein